MNTVKNKLEKPNNDKMAATPKHKPLLNPSLDDLKKEGLTGEKPKKKPVAKKPAAEKPSGNRDGLIEAAKAYTDAHRETPVLSDAQKASNKRINDSHEETIRRIKEENAAMNKAKKEEASAVAMSTDAFSKEVLTEFHKRVKTIKDSIGKIDTGFEKIAFNLHWINSKQAYKSEGFDSIVKYAESAFGYQKTTCYSLIGVVDRFAKRDEKGCFLESFDDRVKGYSVSKLSLMVNLTDAEIDTLNPGMSVRDIKTFVRSLNGKPLPSLSEGNSDSGEEETEQTGGGSGESVIDVEFKEIERQVLITCKGKEDYESKIDKIDNFICRVMKKHPDAVIEISYTLPETTGKEK